jgi:hypothetical protein
MKNRKRPEAGRGDNYARFCPLCKCADAGAELRPPGAGPSEATFLRLGG